MPLKMTTSFKLKCRDCGFRRVGIADKKTAYDTAQGHTRINPTHQVEVTTVQEKVHLFVAKK
jgi:hypothetical protein